mmetsp:Transcript_829/g.1833  ORF Transcript_829/g.1833 Transcript_829/m.1833 type:complete len:109 (-) Transcript_829:542-868(-)
MADASDADGGKGTSKGKVAKGVGKTGGMSYKERQEAELAALEEKLSAEEGFKGKGNALTPWELEVLDTGATDQEEGLYGGRKFMPKHGYFACIRCGLPLYLAQAKFVH